MKLTSFLILLFSLCSCFVTKKKYLALQQEILQLKSDLNDDDQDGVANYLDLEARTSIFEIVDSRGRTIYEEKVIDIDEDGVLDSIDFCPTIKGVSSANGCPDWDNDGIYDFMDKCPKSVGLDSLFGCPFIKEEGVIYVKNTSLNYGIRFIDKTTRYKPKSKVILDTTIAQITKILTLNSNYIIEIKSFTDSIGDSIQNNEICFKRAENIKKLLLKKGIDEKRIFLKPMGSLNPKHSNETKEGREANNRIEFNIIKP